MWNQTLNMDELKSMPASTMQLFTYCIITFNLLALWNGTIPNVARHLKASKNMEALMHKSFVLSCCMCSYHVYYVAYLEALYQKKIVKNRQ